MQRQCSSTDVRAGPNSPQDLTKILAYIRSEYLHGQRVNKATDAVISSSCMWIIDFHFQNPGNTEMYIIPVVRLKIGPDTTTPA